jgi:hypothetical protein
MKTSSAAVAAILLLTSCTGQEVSSTPQATVPTSSAPAESSAPDSEPMSFEDIESGSGRLDPGTYVLHYSSIGGAEAFPTLAFTFTLPAGWDRVIIDGLAWNDKGLRIGFAVVDNLYVDPCDPELGLLEPPVGPSVDDLATALNTVPGIEITETNFDTYFGYPGVRLVVGSLDDPSSCPDDELRLAHVYGFPGVLAGMGEGESHELWILEVEGTRVVVHAVTAAGASAGARAEMQSVIDSIEIQA